MRTEPPFCLAGQLHDPEWLAARQATLETAIAAERECWAKLVSRHAELAAHVQTGV